MSVKIWKNTMGAKKIIFGTLLYVVVKIVYTFQWLCVSVIMCFKNWNNKKVAYKTKYFYILLAFLLVSIGSLIAVSIYCNLLKYQTKQKHLLPHYVTNNKI